MDNEWVVAAHLEILSMNFQLADDIVHGFFCGWRVTCVDHAEEIAPSAMLEGLVTYHETSDHDKLFLQFGRNLK